MPPVNPFAVEAVFHMVGISHQKFLEALRTMGPQHLKTKKMRDAWDPTNPTRNYCYVIGQFTYCYLAPEGSVPYSLVVDDPEVFGTKHYFVRWPNGQIVDLAAEQFPNHELVDYNRGKRASFFPPWPDTRTRLLASLLDCRDVLRASQSAK